MCVEMKKQGSVTRGENQSRDELVAMEKSYRHKKQSPHLSEGPRRMSALVSDLQSI